MTAEIDYIPFANTLVPPAVMPLSSYATIAASGLSVELADPTQANRSWRQSSMFAAALANIISTQLGGINVLDDGNLTTLITNLTAALQTLGASGISLGFNAPVNLSIGASVGSNQLTVSILGTNGSAPSATNPVTIPFRDSTIANGELVAETVTAATTLVIASGDTMGAPSGVPFRLWVVAFNNASTVALGLINCSTPTTPIFPLNEDAPQTSVASGYSTAGVYYTTSVVSAKSIRILGYMEWGSGLTTAGTWATGPTKIQLFGPGQRKPGEPVQGPIIGSGTTQGTTGTVSVFSPFSNPITASITPTASMNFIRVRVDGVTESNGSGSVYQIARGSTLIGTIQAADGALISISVPALDAPGVVTSVTYQLYGKPTSGSGPTLFPYTNAGALSTGGQIELVELMG
jgi:hypothetical protein